MTTKVANLPTANYLGWIAAAGNASLSPVHDAVRGGKPRPLPERGDRRRRGQDGRGCGRRLSECGRAQGEAGMMGGCHQFLAISSAARTMRRKRKSPASTRALGRRPATSIRAPGPHDQFCRRASAAAAELRDRATRRRRARQCARAQRPGGHAIRAHGAGDDAGVTGQPRGRECGRQRGGGRAGR